MQKLDLKEEICFLLSFDIIPLSETFVDSERQYDSFSDYDVFVSKPTKLVPAGSPSRGGDVAAYAFNISQPSLPTPFYSVLVFVSGFMALQLYLIP